MSFNRRTTTQELLANTKAFHERMAKLSNEEFWNEVDKSLRTFNGNKNK